MKILIKFFQKIKKVQLEFNIALSPIDQLMEISTMHILIFIIASHKF